MKTLRLLLGQEPAVEFLSRYWPTTPYVHHGPPERLGAWARAPALTSIPAFLRLPNTRFVLIYTDAAGVFRSFPGDPAHAANLMEDRGMTACLSHIDLPGVAGVPRWSELASSLGVAPEHLRINAYASPPGAGLAPHWDRTDAIIVQLHGTKTWRSAPNRTFPNPTFNYVPHVLSPLDARAANPQGLPVDMPADHTVHTLTPGSVLFLPRGYWHATRAETESISIAIKLMTPRWADLLVNRLRARLLADARWRAAAVGTWGDPGLRAGARDELGALLEGLVGELMEHPLRATDILRAVNPESGLHEPRLADESRLRRNPGVLMLVADDRGDARARLVRLEIGMAAGARTVLDIPAVLRPLTERLAVLGEITSVADIVASLPIAGNASARALVIEYLTALVEAGALSVVAA